ncbi:TPA: hypothetical protein HL447_23290, partial [Escherichia coli]|nr:hypothetical protein [Escherichia coli]
MVCFITDISSDTGTADWLQRLHFSGPETSIIRILTISLKTVGKLSDASCQDIHGASLHAPLALR